MKTPQDSKQTFTELVMPQAKAMYRMALRMTGNRQNAEDFVQDSMLKGYRSFASYKQGTNFKAWIFTILTNTIRNFYRQEKSRGKVQRWNSSDDFSAATPGFHNRLDPTDSSVLEFYLSDEFKRGLDALPARFRKVLLLSVVEEFRYQEIADILKIPIGTVMSRLHRGRKLLRRSLSNIQPVRVLRVA